MTSTTSTSSSKQAAAPAVKKEVNLAPTREVLLNVESYFSSKTWKALVQRVGFARKELMTKNGQAGPFPGEEELAKNLLEVITPLICRTNSIQSLKAWWEKPLLQVLTDDLHLIGLGKSNPAAEQLKEAGNLAYRKADNEAALESWSAALRFNTPEDHNRPNSKKTMANVYANRSLILSDRGSPDLALMDIRRAFQHGYPKENWAKILRRKANCLKNLHVNNFFENPDTVLHEALELSRIHENESVEKAIVKDIEKLKLDRHREFDDDPCIRFPQKADLPAYVSPSIRVMRTSCGRSMVATRDIPAGELLLLEHPLAWAVRRNFRSTHCTGCMIPLMNATGI